MYIALDLELEQPNRGVEITDSSISKSEIIQIGWTVFSALPEFQVHKTTQWCVWKPYRLSSFIKTLTGITDEDIQAGKDPEIIYRKLVEDKEKYNTSPIVCQWGFGDMETLKELITSRVDDRWEFGRSGLNVKHLYRVYAEAKNLSKKSGGLSKCLHNLGLNWEGRGKHQAGVDALNTAKVFAYIMKQIRSGL